MDELKQILDQVDTVIFDCDGVLVDSNGIKSQVFQIVAQKYPEEIQKQFLDYHQTHTGMSRVGKFEYLHNTLLAGKSPGSCAEEDIKEFGEEVMEKYLSSPLTAGVVDFLKRLKEMGKQLYVSSAAMENEVKTLLSNYNLSEYFELICGAPKTKKDHFETIGVNERGQKTLFFGDSEGDFRVSKEFNTHFVFIGEYSNLGHWKSFCKENKIIGIDSFQELL